MDLVLTLDLDTGRANVYERLSPQKLLLVREFSNREEADAYIEHDRKMTESSERVCQDFRTWVAQWVINEAEKIGLEPRLVQFHSHGIPENCQLATNREATVSPRLSQDEERRLIAHAYRMKGVRGLLIKTLFQTGTRVSEFVNIQVEDFFFDEQMILISKAKGGKSRYIPILPELSQELRTHLGNRGMGYLFETIHATPYSPRRIQQIVKETAADAKIAKRVYPHLLRHSVATTLLERGMPLEQIQKLLGHSKLETTQIYAESTPEMIKESYQRALGG